MTAVIFTWPPDYLMAALASRALRRSGVRVVLAIDRKDPLPAVEGCEVVVTDFPRNGNLNGKECVEGILRTLEEQSRPEDPWVLKVDSDALVTGVKWLEGREEEAVGMFHPGHRGFFGFCYGIRRTALPGMRERAAQLKDDPGMYEDVTMGELARPAHRYQNLTEGCPMAAYGWKRQRTRDYWLTRYEIVVFQRVEGITRRNITEKMKEFLA